MSVAPLSNSAAPAAVSAPTTAPDSSNTIISVQGLERTGKIAPLLVIALGLILTLAAWYGVQQAQKAYLDTLITERGARNAETRQMVVDLTAQFNQAEIKNAQFRGETLASLKAIEKAVDTERGDRRDDRR